MSLKPISTTPVILARNAAILSDIVPEAKKTTTLPKVAVISGASAQTARTAMLNFLNRGYQIIGLSSSKTDMQYKHPNLTFVQIDRNLLTKSSHFEQAIQKGLENLGLKSSPLAQLNALNLIGAPTASGTNSLRTINHEIPMSFFNAGLCIGKERGAKTGAVQVSTIVTILAPELEYALSKEATDRALMDSDFNTAVVLRPGIICPEPSIEGRVSMVHPYSPEQFATSLVIPIAGSGNQIQQPVSEEELYEAAMNGLERDVPSHQIVNAVGSDAVTQMELFRHFNARQKVIFAHINCEVLSHLANKFPFGRIAPYSTEVFRFLDESNRSLSGREFEQLLGRKPRGYRTIYPARRVMSIAKPPLGEHMRYIFRTPFAALKCLTSSIVSCVQHFPGVSFSIDSRPYENDPDCSITKTPPEKKDD